MSDSVTKYYEDGEKNLISPEEKRELDILELISLAVKADKIAIVSERAEQVQKEFKGASLLVGLQIACDEEGLI
jgi:hypothetical protein